MRPPYRIWFERTPPIRYAELLSGVAVVAGAADQTPADTWGALSGAHAIIASGRLRYDAAVMDLSPALRVIARTGIGVDNVSVEDATRRGIAVCNAPDGPTISTAEHAVMLLLAVAKRLKRLNSELQRGGKRDYFNDYDGYEVNGLRLGLVGLGRIGRHVATIANALGMSVSAYDPYVSSEQLSHLNVELEPDLNNLLSASDILSLHVPLTEQTR
jgi:D-3-phosphoglycerate dehydrogenase